MHFTYVWALLLSISFASAQVYRVHNNCPSSIELFIGADSQGTLATGSNLTFTGLGPSTSFYTKANGAAADVNGQFPAVQAGFFFVPNFWYYYIVRNENANLFNTGVSIKPSQPEANGFCRTAQCDSGECNTAFRHPPVFNGGPPPADGPAPNPPNFQCKVEPSQVSFDVTFCPSGSWPPEVGTPVNPNFNANKCIDVQGNVLANGTPVQIYDCNGTPAQRWVVYEFGATKLRLANSNFCLDAGSTPGDGVQMKIWQCFDNLAAQQWNFTNDNRLSLSGSPNVCLDLPSGDTANGNVLQTWTCGNNNNNQVWDIGDPSA